MPTNRTRTTRKRKAGPVAGWKAQYLLSGEWPPKGTPDYDSFDELIFDEKPRKGISPAQELWKIKREELLHYWIEKHPGTRPYAWWKFDALENRLRLGGTGTPCHECLAYAPIFRWGVPASWISKRDEEYYNGRSKDIHGKPIGTKYSEGDFKGKAIDPNDPPIFESQAAYLKRLGLLTPAEQKRLTKKDYAPEILARS